MEELTFQHNLMSCPPLQELAEFRHRKLDQTLDADIRDHLTWCRWCRHRLTLLATEPIEVHAEMPEGFMMNVNQPAGKFLAVSPFQNWVFRLKEPIVEFLRESLPMAKEHLRSQAAYSRLLLQFKGTPHTGLVMPVIRASFGELANLGYEPTCDIRLRLKAEEASLMVTVQLTPKAESTQNIEVTLRSGKHAETQTITRTRTFAEFTMSLFASLETDCLLEFKQRDA